ncbi:hypothetical protein V2A60_004848 [Cordyceps javanica]|uniref:Methyltransferase domain-containing protein n=1 Tax=Cordyceps javanica TaxID=43265 RepID=A0A545WAE1_9HYPO|nr:methyltransferase domain-containing protein [Cordyceps javanica]TQW10950.1 methyltransferase domain-containing protein [Cordyceps javanica]
MAAAMPEETFRSYSKQQARTYARFRQDYSPALYDSILSFHTSSGGQDTLLLDVGCGPGNVTRALASHFERAVGLDASPAMVLQAEEQSRDAGACTKTGAAPRFHQSSAEALGAALDGDDAVRDGSVDLITVANAAHWFDMPAFWRAAGRALRPRGTVAVWISGEGVVHPSTPGAAALDALLQRFIARDLLPHYLPGNLLFRDRYRGLPLPWTVVPPVPGFVEAAFERREWDLAARDAPSPPPTLLTFGTAGGGGGGGGGDDGDEPVGLDTVEAALSTMSPVTRWRAAHPERVGTERDVVRMLRRDMEAVLRSHGVRQGEERVRMIMDGTLLLFKKSDTSV